MRPANTEAEAKTAPSDVNGINGKALPADSDRLTHRFHPGLGDHPLWQALMDEMEKNRQSDIAEANCLADLELEE